MLVEVNVAREEGKSGVAPAELDAFLERCPARVVGLMTMPPLAERPEDSRRWFAALAELAGERGLRELSMGTTQDYARRRRGGRHDRRHRHDACIREVAGESRQRANLPL